MDDRNDFKVSVKLSGLPRGTDEFICDVCDEFADQVQVIVGERVDTVQVFELKDDWDCVVELGFIDSALSPDEIIHMLEDSRIDYFCGGA